MKTENEATRAEMLKRSPIKTETAMWSLWRDFFQSTKTWKMKTPVGILSFRTKRLALAAKVQYELSISRGGYR